MGADKSVLKWAPNIEGCHIVRTIVGVPFTGRALCDFAYQIAPDGSFTPFGHGFFPCLACLEKLIEEDPLQKEPTATYDFEEALPDLMRQRQ